MDIQIMLVLQLIIKFYQKIEQRQFKKMNILFLMVSKKKTEYKYNGFGEEFPVDSNDNEEEGQKIEEQK